MIAEACSMFGWTVDYVLKMPARQFFAMLGAGRRNKAMEHVLQCDIALIPSCDPEYFENTRENFMNKAFVEGSIELTDEQIKESEQALIARLGAPSV